MGLAGKGWLRGLDKILDKTVSWMIPVRGWSIFARNALATFVGQQFETATKPLYKCGDTSLCPTACPTLAAGP